LTALRLPLTVLYSYKLQYYAQHYQSAANIVLHSDMQCFISSYLTTVLSSLILLILYNKRIITVLIA